MYYTGGVVMKHEAMMRLMYILIDYGLSETEALSLIATLLMQESAALAVMEEEPSMTLC